MVKNQYCSWKQKKGKNSTIKKAEKCKNMMTRVHQRTREKSRIKIRIIRIPHENLQICFSVGRARHGRTGARLSFATNAYPEGPQCPSAPWGAQLGPLRRSALPYGPHVGPWWAQDICTPTFILALTCACVCTSLRVRPCKSKWSLWPLSYSPSSSNRLSVNQKTFQTFSKNVLGPRALREQSVRPRAPPNVCRDIFIRELLYCCFWKRQVTLYQYGGRPRL